MNGKNSSFALQGIQPVAALAYKMADAMIAERNR